MWGNLYHPQSQKELVEYLQATGALKDSRVVQVLTSVDRGRYCGAESTPYVDGPMPIGHGATISAPHMHAYALQALRKQLVPGGRALDVGSGSGYLTACMALMVGPSGLAVGVEHVSELLKRSLANVKADKPNLLDSGTIKLVEGDGRMGYPADGPYDAIHVGAAAANIPRPLLDQLRPGGRLVIPVGDPGISQVMTIVDKLADGTVKSYTDANVRYVPLCDRAEQSSGGI